MSNLLCFMNDSKCAITILSDSSGSISYPKDFTTLIACVIALIERSPDISKIQIINFSTTAEIISEFNVNKEEVKKDVFQKLKYLGGCTNLDAALKLSLQRINTKQKEYENIVVVITDGMPTDNPSQTISEMMAKNIKFYNVGVGGVTQTQMDNLFPGQSNMIFSKYDDLIDYINQFSSQDYKHPLLYKFYPTNNKIQKTSEDLKITCEISPTDNNEVFKPKEIELSLISNKYYAGWNIIVDKKVDIFNPYKVELTLRLASNYKIKDLPNSIEFLFKAKKKTFRGFFSLDLTWFAGDLISRFFLNIFVDGMMGHGKSSLLNLLFNLFTSSKTIDHQFFASRNETHTTKGIEFNPICHSLMYKEEDDTLPIHNEIIEKIKIVLVDKAGITANNNNIDYHLATKGCYVPNSEKIDISFPNQAYECHSFIFVVSMDTFSTQAEIFQIKSKITECISRAKIQPILVVTFGDRYEHEERELIKKDIYELAVEKENIFFVTPYINSETTRNSHKDLIGFTIIKRAVEIAKKTIENKYKSESQQNYLNERANQYNQNSFSPKFLKVNNTPSELSYVGDDNNSVPNSPSLNTPSKSLPDGASNDKSKSKIISVNYCSKITKFRVAPSLTVDNFILQVGKKFSIDNFYFEDQDGCEVSGDSSFYDIADDISHLTISFN